MSQPILKDHWNYAKFSDMTKRQQWATCNLLRSFHKKGRTPEISPKKSHEMRDALSAWGYLPHEKNPIVGRVNQLTEIAKISGPEAEASYLKEVEELVIAMSRRKVHFTYEAPRREPIYA